MTFEKYCLVNNADKTVKKKTDKKKDEQFYMFYKTGVPIT